MPLLHKYPHRRFAKSKDKMFTTEGAAENAEFKIY